jgi:hypothetical protein
MRCSIPSWVVAAIAAGSAVGCSLNSHGELEGPGQGLVDGSAGSGGTTTLDSGGTGGVAHADTGGVGGSIVPDAGGSGGMDGEDAQDQDAVVTADGSVDDVSADVPVVFDAPAEIGQDVASIDVLLVDAIVDVPLEAIVEPEASTVCPESTAKWFGTHCYFRRSNLHWTPARDHCASMPGTHLVTITEQAEYDFIATNFGGQDQWIGLHATVSNPPDHDKSKWAWITGEAFTLDKWQSNDPSNGDECGMLKSSNNLFANHDCSENHAPICEWEP